MVEDQIINNKKTPNVTIGRLDQLTIFSKKQSNN